MQEFKSVGLPLSLTCWHNFLLASQLVSKQICLMEGDGERPCLLNYFTPHLFYGSSTSFFSLTFSTMKQLRTDYILQVSSCCECYGLIALDSAHWINFINKQICIYVPALSRNMGTERNT